MAINFNALPTEKPAMAGSLIPKGQYVATIEKAEMKQGKNESKPPYLNLQLGITDEASGAPMGKVFHILTESEHPLPMYQLSRLIHALHLPITDTFELKDLVKMIQNKKMLVDIMPEDVEKGKEPSRSVIDVFSGQIFYPHAPTANPVEDALETDVFVQYDAPSNTPVVEATEY